MRTRKVGTAALALAGAALLGTAGTAGAADAKKAGGGKMSALKVVPAADTAWQPLDPKAPDGPQIAILWGDPGRAPVGFLLRVKAGTQFPRHSHTFAYDAVVVQGEWKHTYEGETDSAALPAGSHWHQPGKRVHGDGCASASGECILLVSYPRGKRDFVPAEGRKSM
ncbi:MAG TPA: cupin domain-containing protein [Anaeromyxobacteraceae bacterium]|jgi:hypothetical protein